MTNWLKDIRIQSAICAVFAACLYANTIANGFVYDDYKVFVDNKGVQKGIEGIGEIWSGKILFNSLQYRPFTSTLFALEQHLCRNNPAVAHLVNVILFSALCAMIVLCMKELFGFRYPLLPFLTGIFFCLHPIHTEVVASIKGADEILCFIFFCICFLSLTKWIDYKEKSKFSFLWLANAGLAFLMACFSKESGIIQAALIPLCIWFKPGAKPRDIAQIAVVLISTCILYCLWFFCIVHGNSAFQNIRPINNFLVSITPFCNRFSTALIITGRYLLLLIFPFPLVHDYGYGQLSIVNFADYRTFIMLLIYALLAIIAVVGLKKKAIYSFGIIFFAGSLIIVSNLLFLIGTAMAERLLFMPSLGFCVILAYLILRFSYICWPKLPNRRQLVLLSCCIPIFISYAWLTADRNIDWRTNLSLFSNDINISPKSATLNANLGNALLHEAIKSKPQEKERLTYLALSYLIKSIKICPGFAYSRANCGMAYYLLGKEDSALSQVSMARYLDPKDRISWLTCGDLWMNKLQYDSAIFCYKKALCLEPMDTTACVKLADAYCIAGNFTRALDEYRNIINRNPALEKTLKPRLEYANRMKAVN